MNERIKLLAKQCWDERPEGQLHFDNEKFADLVAAQEREECAKLMFRLDLCGEEMKAAKAIRARGTT